ncbi:TRAP transporter small permease [Pikeienuella piscinae]|uniref:TRAP transporter small permease protein n=1 Tax=Pikeienuella piscinae TaxID=2748098 RepID=A0A7L5BXT0_9RHOB|nr:TRAP transporter small permease [Pikeienuella piscinae]QIE55056.1 TRAP transporter small permease [Pikeienuella piscinae]
MRPIITTLIRINTAIERIVIAVGALIVAAMVLIVFGGALTRYATGIGFGVAVELPPMLMPWLVFPLAGVLLRSGSHIAVDFLPEKLGGGGLRVLRAVIALIAIGAGATFVIAGWDAASLFRDIGQVTEMEWEFPIWYIYLSFPVGFAVLISFAVENLLLALTGLDDTGGGDSAGVHAVTE